MTLAQAKNKLPRFAFGLAAGVRSLSELESRATKEVHEYALGNNPLTPLQAASLKKFAKSIGGMAGLGLGRK